MNALRFDDPSPCAPYLRELGACADAVAWVGDRDCRTALAECQRADWILWLCGKMHGQPTWPTRQRVVLAACACAETALGHVRPGEDRPRLAIETARRWARRDASVTLEDVRHAAAAAADAAYDAAKGVEAALAVACRVGMTREPDWGQRDALAAYAAAAAAYGAYDAAKGVEAALAVACRVGMTREPDWGQRAAIAAAAAADAAYAAARKASLVQMADLLRRPETWR